MESLFVSSSEQATLEYATKLGASLPTPVRILLVGELGAGKTTFTKGLAAGFGLADMGDVSSPTFTLVNRYTGRVPIYHVDLYRVDSDDPFHLPAEILLLHHKQFHALFEVIGHEVRHDLAVGANNLRQEIFAHVNLVKGERSFLAELASNLL